MTRFILALLLIVAGCEPVCAQMPMQPPVQSAPVQPDYPLGSVFVTRNFDERFNTSPGYYNHLAVYVGNGQVVESMQGIGVRRAMLYDLWHRNYSQILVLKPRDWLCGACAARRAEWLVGRPYGKLSSLWPFYGPVRLTLGLNCVSVVEFSYGYGGLDFPDDAFRWQGSVFQVAEVAR